LEEKVEPERPVFWFYAYSYGPCKRRVAIVNYILDDLITEFNFSHPAIAAELKELASNLKKKAIEWDEHAHLSQQSQQWIDPSRLNPIEVKGAAAALCYKLRQIGSMVREEKQNADLDSGGKVGETKQKKRRKKTPPQLLKETRERHAAQELTKNPNITAEKLGKMLECDKSTIVRLKAWQNRRTLAYSPPPNGFKKQDDEGRTDTEAIGENESNNEIENL
jgi:hypothetical protein